MPICNCTHGSLVLIKNISLTCLSASSTGTELDDTRIVCQGVRKDMMKISPNAVAKLGADKDSHFLSVKFPGPDNNEFIITKLTYITCRVIHPGILPEHEIWLRKEFPRSLHWSCDVWRN